MLRCKARGRWLPIIGNFSPWSAKYLHLSRSWCTIPWARRRIDQGEAEIDRRGESGLQPSLHLRRGYHNKRYSSFEIQKRSLFGFPHYHSSVCYGETTLHASYLWCSRFLAPANLVDEHFVRIQLAAKHHARVHAHWVDALNAWKQERAFLGGLCWMRQRGNEPSGWLHSRQPHE